MAREPAPIPTGNIQRISPDGKVGGEYAAAGTGHLRLELHDLDGEIEQIAHRTLFRRVVPALDRIW